MISSSKFSEPQPFDLQRIIVLVWKDLNLGYWAPKLSAIKAGDLKKICHSTHRTPLEATQVQVLDNDIILKVWQTATLLLFDLQRPIVDTSMKR